MYTNAKPCHWQVQEVTELMQIPLSDLLYRAQTVHRENFDPNQIQVSTLLSIKTGACPEDCSYCSQSARHETGLEKEKLLQPARKSRVRQDSVWVRHGEIPRTPIWTK
jgi:biotin synthase-like enzyme